MNFPLWPANGLSYITAPPSRDFTDKPIRSIAVLGSTGSIGRNALDVVVKSGALKVVALAAGKNIRLLASQAELFRPEYLAVANSSLATELENLLCPIYRPIIFWGRDGYSTMASLPEVDLVLSAQSGSAGLPATLAAAMAGKVIALANKESLVLAGSLLRKLCDESRAAILPVDSEHYALFQCAAGRGENVRSLVLTASGGPFFGKSRAEIADATPEMATKHPNWSMGSKISVDSATMMNKGLELIEAMRLFGLNPEAIRIVVHPQSIVHSLVEFEDNSLLGQFAVPDMRLALGGCLLWPYAGASFVRPLDLSKIGELDFFRPDISVFPCLGLAKRAAFYTQPRPWTRLRLNPACIVLNAANEAAVSLFLCGKIRFGEIANRIRRAMNILLEDPPLPEKTRIDASLSIPARAAAYADMIAPLENLAAKIVSEDV